MKYIILLLFATLAQADIHVKRVSLGTDYAFSYVENGVQYCWVMPEWVDLNYFDYTWRTVPNTTVLHSWPVPTPEQTASCSDAPPIPRVVQMHEDELPCLYSTSGQLNRMSCAARIPAGTPCGEKVANYFNTGFSWHVVAHAGQRGLSLCY